MFVTICDMVCAGLPLAAVWCLPSSNIELKNLEMSKILNGLDHNEASNDFEFKPLPEARFDTSTTQFLDCGTTLSNISDSIEDLPKLAVLTSRPENLTNEDVTIAANTLALYLNNSQEEAVNEQTLHLVTSTTSNLYRGEEMNRNGGEETQRSVETKQMLLQTLNGFAELVEIPPGDSLLQILAPNITVQVQSRIEEEIEDGSGIKFMLRNIEVESLVIAEIPLESIRKSRLQSNRNKRSSIASDGNPTFYATLVDQQLNSSQNTSQVISLGVRNADMAQLSFEITYEDVDYPEREVELENGIERRLSQAQFSQRNFVTLEWDPSTCRGSPPQQTFQCNQQSGSFAMLFSSRVVPSAAALSIVGYIGSVLSMLFLFATVFIYLRYKELRNKPTTPTLVNICICLIGVYLFYIVGVGSITSYEGCNTLTFFLHYFLLSCFSWMTVNAYQMLRAFTSITYGVKRIQIPVYLFAYGLPFLLVTLNICLTVLYLDFNQKYNNVTDIRFESLYRAKFTCWLQAPSFYWGFLLPAGVLLLFNIIAFGILIKKVAFRKQENVRSTAKERPLVDRLVNSITLVTVMGLTWIFGYFLLVPFNLVYEEAMQWLFTIFNVFQGLVIFYLYCLRRKNIRQIWWKSKSKPKSLLVSTNQSNSKTGETGKVTSSQETKQTSIVATEI